MARTRRPAVPADQIPRHLLERYAQESRPPTSRAIGPDRSGPYTCHACGAQFAKFAGAERHAADEHGGGRIDCPTPTATEETQ